MSWSDLDIVSVLVIFGGVALVIVMMQRWLKVRSRANEGFIKKLKNYKDGKWSEKGQAVLVMAAAIFLGLAMLGPQWGERQLRSEATGADVMFVLDVSKSMMAEDMSSRGEVRDRLATAKEMIGEYVMENPDNRYGLVVFAGDAFVSSPLTFDKNAFVTFLTGVSYKDVGEQGTNLGEALKITLGRFGDGDEERGKVVVLVSDGGDDIESNYEQLAKQAAENNVKIVAVGLGDKSGVPIPEGKDMFGRNVYKTYGGEQVLTRLNDKPLKDVAEATGGEYVQAKSASDMNKVSSVIEGVEKSTLLKSEGMKQENRYQWFLAPAILFLGIAVSWPLALSTRRNK